MDKHILIVDDEADIRSLLKGVLEDEDYKCHQAKNSDEFFDNIAVSLPSLILLDVWLEDSVLDGVGILSEFVSKYPDIPVVMMSGHGTIETAVSAIKMGAYDFIEKPFDIERILMTVNRALEVSSLKKENRKLRADVGDNSIDIHGVSPQTCLLRQTIEKVAPTESRVLITGDQGVGKGVVARRIHDLSPRCNEPFISLNCASVSVDQLDMVLFGCEDSDKSKTQKGVIEQAYGGTLFIDEIAEMPIDTQGKLVRTLQENRLTRIGSLKSQEIDIRLISATNQNLEEKILSKTFREDLYYRLNVVQMQIAPLADRRVDIPVLAEYFLNSQEIRSEHNLSLSGKCVLSEEALAILQGYLWPGNVRQLKNVMEWLVIMYGHKTDDEKSDVLITADMLPPELKQMPKSFQGDDPVIALMAKPLREAREVFERRYLLAQIERFDGNISKTASFIGMERSALHRKLKALTSNEEKDRMRG